VASGASGEPPSRRLHGSKYSSAKALNRGLVNHVNTCLFAIFADEID
jgi:hypothetical protein